MLGNKGKLEVIKIFFSWGILILFILTLFVGGYFFFLLGSVDNKDEGKEITIEIKNNDTGEDISSLLYEKGLTKNENIFYWYVRFKNLDQDLKTGQYVLSTDQFLREIVSTIVNGSIILNSFTVPEGYSLNQIIDLLVSRGLVDEAIFKDLLANGEFDFYFLEGLEPGEKRLEGYLFPDTYYVSPESSESQIIEMMLKRTEEVLGSLDVDAVLEKSSYNLHELITIASMVEREAKLDEERPIISGVIYNRLKVGMKLQIDATVVYALGGEKEGLSLADLTVDSPYNTYLYEGLPVGPIASPGKVSLEAAFHPKNTEYLYYVAKPDGSHAFTESYEKHLQNVNTYLN